MAPAWPIKCSTGSIMLIGDSPRMSGNPAKAQERQAKRSRLSVHSAAESSLRKRNPILQQPGCSPLLNMQGGSIDCPKCKTSILDIRLVNETLSIRKGLCRGCRLCVIRRYYEYTYDTLAVYEVGRRRHAPRCARPTVLLPALPHGNAKG